MSSSPLSATTTGFPSATVMPRSIALAPPTVGVSIRGGRAQLLRLAIAPPGGRQPSATGTNRASRATRSGDLPVGAPLVGGRHGNPGPHHLAVANGDRAPVAAQRLDHLQAPPVLVRRA